MAKPMPTEPPDGEKIAVLMPMTSPLHVEHRTAGVAPVDRRVGLEEVVVGSGVDVAGAGGNDAGGHRAAEAEGIADRQHPVADPHVVAVAERHRRQLLVGLDPQQGQIGLGVAADQFGLQVGVVLKDDVDLVGVLDDVVVGHHQPAGIDDEARSQRRGAAGRGVLLTSLTVEEVAEELLERRSWRKLRHFRTRTGSRTPALGNILRGRNVDHGRKQFLSQIGEALRSVGAALGMGFGYGGEQQCDDNRQPGNPPEPCGTPVFGGDCHGVPLFGIPHSRSAFLRALFVTEAFSLLHYATASSRRRCARALPGIAPRTAGCQPMYSRPADSCRERLFIVPGIINAIPV